MNITHKTAFAALFLAGLMLAGCRGRPTEEPLIPESLPTEQPPPTATSLPPTAIPQPTATSTPIPVVQATQPPAPTSVPPTQPPPPTATPLPLPPLPPSTAVFFETGATSATVTGSVNTGGAAGYRLRASAGQVMIVSVTSPTSNVYLDIIGASTRQKFADRSSRQTRWWGRLPAMQDYIIQVVPEGQNATFTLTITIPVRLTFDAGATVLNVDGSVVGGAPFDYILGASSGQLLTAMVDSPASEFVVAASGVDGTPLVSATDATFVLSEALPSSQDYLVQVIPTGGETDFSLQISIPVRITFQPGAISATVEGTLQSGQHIDYVLRALAGQTMTVSVASPNDDVLLSVTGAEDGQPYLRRDLGQNSWAGTLPATQDYLLGVTLPPIGNALSYVLTVEVQ